MNYVIACFVGRSTLSTTDPLWQWDYGQLLIIRGLDLPAAFEVHWTDRETGTTTTTIGSTTEGVSAVTIPDVYLESGREITAFIYLHTTETDGETDYKITIPVLERPQPTHETPTPVQQSEIEQIIAALNAEADRAEAAAEDAESSAAESASSAASSAASATEAANSATAAAGSATNAASSATASAASATAAAGSATNAASSATAAAGSATAATGSATAAAGSATAAAGSASNAASYAAEAAESAEAAADSATEAAEIIESIDPDEINRRILAAFPHDTADGGIASFPDGADNIPLASLFAQIEPVQASGTPTPESPIPIIGRTGAIITITGVNLMPSAIPAKIIAATLNTSGRIASASNARVTVFRVPRHTNICVQKIASDRDAMSIALCDTNNIAVGTPCYNFQSVYNVGQVTINTENHEWFLLQSNSLDKLRACWTTRQTMISVGTARKTYVAPSTDYQNISVSWQSDAGTVYGGTLEIDQSGAVTLLARPYYASYNGEALIGPWVSSMDVYAPGSSPTTGAQVVDLGGAETTYQLTIEQIVTLLGDNGMWTDAGDIAVDYRADPTLYIAKKIGG